MSQLAFLSHESACRALRLLSSSRGGIDALARWPQESQRLPPAHRCISGQREFKGSSAEKTLDALGLSKRPVDLVVSAQEARSSGKSARFHLWSGMLPPRSFLIAGPTLLVSGPELVIAQLCSSQSKMDALLDAHAEAVQAELGVLAELNLNERPVVDHPLRWEHVRRLVAAVTVACEFAGTYRLGCEGRPAAYQAPPLMSLASLRHRVTQMTESQGTRRALKVCELALAGSASPMETIVALMLSLPVEFGGFGLERPRLNCPIDVSGHRGDVSDRDIITPDLLWPEHGVALEYDSAEFHAAFSKKQEVRDAVRANTLTSLGYRVLRATPGSIRSLSGLTLLARQLARTLGTQLAPTTPVQDLRRRRLYAELMPKAAEQ